MAKITGPGLSLAPSTLRKPSCFTSASDTRERMKSRFRTESGRESREQRARRQNKTVIGNVKVLVTTKALGMTRACAACAGIELGTCYLSFQLGVPRCTFVTALPRRKQRENDGSALLYTARHTNQGSNTTLKHRHAFCSCRSLCRVSPAATPERTTGGGRWATVSSS